MEWIQGKLICRYKRFLMDLSLPGGSVETVHCPNSGSMEGCLEAGAPVVATEGRGKKRKLRYTAEWIRLTCGWVGINTHRTNAIAGEALRARRIPDLSEYESVRAEVPYGERSRVDFLLTGEGLPDCYVEVKNVTLPTDDGAIAFPDAVTERGQKHLRELMAEVERGHRSVMLFVVNRPDGDRFRPAGEKDPVYADLLNKAASAGVEVMAYRTAIDPPNAELGDPVPVLIP